LRNRSFTIVSSWTGAIALIAWARDLADHQRARRSTAAHPAMAARTKSAKADRLPEVLKALAEPRRVAIVRLVHERELPAGEIAKHFRTTRQAVSQHLRMLTNAGVLGVRRDGTRRLYRVRTEAFGELRAFLDIFWDDRLSLLKRQVEAGTKGRHGGR
jgi:DNA-binding transcriptional ArsR family regulator